MRLSAFIVLIALFSCGGGGGSSGNSEPNEINQEHEKTETPGSMYLETKDDLPECTTGNKNALAYVADEAQFFYCKDNTWTVANIKGKDGKDGEDGVNGEDGMSIKRIVSCDPSSDLDPSADRGILSRGIEVTEFSNGSYQMVCKSQMFDLSLGWLDNTTDVKLYAANTNGVAMGLLICTPQYVTAFYDIDARLVDYYDQADSDNQEQVLCDEIYPGN